MSIFTDRSELLNFISARISGASQIVKNGGDSSNNVELIQRAMSLDTSAATSQILGDLELAARYRELSAKLRDIVQVGKKN